MTMVVNKYTWLLLTVSFLSVADGRAYQFQENLKIFIFNSKEGNDTCCMDPTSSVPCKSLEVAKSILAKYNSNIQVEIEDSTTLSVVLEVTNASYVTIKGIAGHTQVFPVIQCEGNAGINIRFTQHFSLTSLSLVGCNVQHDSGYLYGYAVAIRYSSDVLFSGIQISNSNSTATVISNCTGEITLENTVFKSNGKKYNLNMKNSFPGGLSIDQSGSGHEQVNYYILNCTFDGNVAPYARAYTHDEYSHSSSSPSFRGLGHGGALSISIGGNTSNSTITINDSKFTRNCGTRGGGIYASFEGNASNNTISVNNSTFSMNSAEFSGAGLEFGYFSTPTLNNVISVSICTFVQNRAKFGAGLSIFAEYNNVNTSGFQSVFISDCTWLNNSGVLSSAVDISPIDPDQDKNGFLPEVSFSNCQISNNTIGGSTHSLTKPATNHINSGVFIVTRFKVIFSGNTTFSANRYTALVLVSATVELQSESTILFEKNTGYDGGAVSMYGFSLITLSKNLNLTFSRNHALNHGGAIVYRTIDQHNIISGKNCFFRHKNLNNRSLTQTTKIVFDYNTADEAGSSIYSESFTACCYQCWDSVCSTTKWNNASYFTYSDILKCLANYTFIGGSQNQLVSGGRAFRFHQNFPTVFHVIPGDQVTMSFDVVDDFDQKVTPLMTVNKKDTTNTNVSVKQIYVLTSTISPVGTPWAYGDFTFSVHSVRQIYFHTTISLLPCPPGFKAGSRVCECASHDKGYGDIIECETLRAKVKPGLWVGYIPSTSLNHTDLFFAPCASPMCTMDSNLLSMNDRSKGSYLPKNGSKLNSYICDDYRHEVLCGMCMPGYSTYYHSRNFQCKTTEMCHLGFLFYFLSEIIPMVTFFVIVVMYDFSFTSGKSVGFIFYTQYLDKLTVHISRWFSYLRTPYRVFYGLFNFEFFNVESLSFCPWQSSQVLDVIAMKYITIAIALGLVLILIIFLQKNHCNRLCYLRKRVSAKTSVVHGLSAFLTICYAQISRTSFYILKYSTLVGYRGHEKGSYSYYGGLNYFQGKHLLYAIPALLSLVVVTVLPPLVLLLYPLSLQFLSLCGLSEHWMVLKALRVVSFHKLIPFIDCFQSCYKDKYRYFAGLYFIYRLIILVCFSIDPHGYGFHVYSEIALILFLGVHALVQPYKEHLHNTLDTLILFNLALINACVILTNQLRDYYLVGPGILKPTAYIDIVNAIQLLLLYLPMLVVCGVGGRKLLRILRSWNTNDQRIIHVDVNDILDYDDRMRDDNIRSVDRVNYGSVDTS